MAFTFGRIKTFADGDTLTAPDLNAELDNILSNATPTSIGAQTLSSLLTVVATAGAANSHVLMNAAGTLPEYVVPYKIGTFTRAMDATGAPTDVAYTGVGFKPKAIIFISSLMAASFSVGLDDGTSSASSFGYGTSATFGISSCCIELIETGVKTQKATVKTMDADGFTLTWTRTGATASATATIYYIALR
jgi:hypothetical protein